MGARLTGIGVGALARDAESRFTNDGREMLSFTIPQDEYAPKGQKANTTWLRVTLSGNRVEGIKPYLLKGQMVKVVGDLKIGLFEGTNGTRVNVDMMNPSLELFGPSAAGNQDQSDEPAAVARRIQTPARTPNRPANARGAAPQLEEDDGDFPF